MFCRDVQNGQETPRLYEVERAYTRYSANLEVRASGEVLRSESRGLGLEKEELRLVTVMGLLRRDGLSPASCFLRRLHSRSSSWRDELTVATSRVPLGEMDKQVASIPTPCLSDLGVTPVILLKKEC